MDHKWSLLLMLLASQLPDLIFCDPIHDDVEIREKRSLICYFGLTDVVKETINASLEDARAQDPLPLDDAWNGRLQNGVFKGLSTLSTPNDLHVFCDENDMVVINTTLRMKDVQVWYRWRTTVFPYCKKKYCIAKGSILMKTHEVEIDIEVHLNSTHGNHFEVTKSSLSKVDIFKVYFDGLKILDPLVSKTMKVMYFIFRKKAIAKVGRLLKRTMERKLNKVGRSLEWISFK